MSETISIKDLTKVYRDGDIIALRGVTISIRQGEFIIIVGPSGSGKTTLLNIIGLLDKRTEGELTIDGVEVKNGIDEDALRARKIGFVFQLHNLIPNLTALENVEIPMYARKISSSERRTRAKELLAQVALSHRENSLAVRLSGGERQRVAIARALANEPAILLCDEPTGNLDSATGDEIARLIRGICTDKKVTVVLVTHNLELTKYADKVVQMRDGKIEKILDNNAGAH